MAIVTVITPVRNGELFIQPAIDSILSQSFADFEYLVINDASDDGTLGMLQSYNDSRIRVLNNTERMGVSASRNCGLTEVKSPFVAFLDADDIAYPDRLEKQVEFLECHPNVVLVGSHIDYIDPQGKLLFSEKPGQRPSDSHNLRLELLKRACILPSTAMGRTDALREVGGFLSMDYAEDHDLWCRLAVNHDLAIMSDRLVAYRLHPNQATFKKIAIAHRETMICCQRAQDNFVAAGIIRGDDRPTPLTLWDRLRGRRGTLGAAYIQWAELYAWALRVPRHAVLLAGMAVWLSPLNFQAWRILLRGLWASIVPSTLSRTMSWYGTKLKSAISRKR